VLGTWGITGLWEINLVQKASSVRVTSKESAETGNKDASAMVKSPLLLHKKLERGGDQKVKEKQGFLRGKTTKPTVKGFNRNTVREREAKSVFRLCQGHEKKKQRQEREFKNNQSGGKLQNIEKGKMKLLFQKGHALYRKLHQREPQWEKIKP